MKPLLFVSIGGVLIYLGLTGKAGGLFGSLFGQA
jgi:hypothetical protein